MRHVALPGLVGQIRLEAGPAGARTLLRLGDHEATTAHDPVDGRESRHRGPLLAQMPGDGTGSGVEAVLGQALAPGHDLVLEHGRGEVGRHLGPPSPRCQGPLAARPVQGDVALHPGLRAPRGRCHGPHGAPFDEYGIDAVLGQIHGTASERVSQNC